MFKTIYRRENILSDSRTKNWVSNDKHHHQLVYKTTLDCFPPWMLGSATQTLAKDMDPFMRPHGVYLLQNQAPETTTIDLIPPTDFVLVHLVKWKHLLILHLFKNTFGILQGSLVQFVSHPMLALNVKLW